MEGTFFTTVHGLLEFRENLGKFFIKEWIMLIWMNRAYELNSLKINMILNWLIDWNAEMYQNHVQSGTCVLNPHNENLVFSETAGCLLSSSYVVWLYCNICTFTCQTIIQ